MLQKEEDLAMLVFDSQESNPPHSEQNDLDLSLAL